MPNTESLDLDVPVLGSPGWGPKVRSALFNIDKGNTYDLAAHGWVSGMDATALVNDLVSRAPMGSVIQFPPGIVIMDPIVVPKMLKFRGYGRFISWCQPRTAITGPLITFDVLTGTGLNRGTYGCGVEHMGIDMYNSPAGTGLHYTSNSGWPKTRHFYCQGGAVSIDNRGPNGWIEDVVLVDAEKFVVLKESGLEIRFRNISTNRNTAGTTTQVLECICDNAGPKAAIYIQEWIHNTGFSGGVATTGGIKVTAPSPVSLPMFVRGLILDNGSGPNPGIELTNIGDTTWSDGWVNTAGSPGAPCVRITNGFNHKFRSMDYYGGGSPAKTYDLVGAISGFSSTGCYDPTGPPIYINTGAAITDLEFDDRVPGATVLAQITNNIEAMRAAMAFKWGNTKLMDRLELYTWPWLASPAVNIGTMVAGSVTIAAPEIDSFYSQFIPFVFSPSGTLGVNLQVSSKDSVGDTVTIISRRGDGTQETGDVSLVGYVRFDIPH